MQALKMFTQDSNSGGGTDGGHGGQGGGGGGGGQNQLVGLAMAQASKLFDEQSGQGKLEQGADKQSAVTKAGEMALKMYLKSGQQGGGGGGGGLLGKLLQ